MERKLLSLPSFFVLLLVAGIAFLAVPVADVSAAPPELIGTNPVVVLPRTGTPPAVPTANAPVTATGVVELVVVKFDQAVKVNGLAGATAATGFGKEDIKITVTDTSTGAALPSYDLPVSAITVTPLAQSTMVANMPKTGAAAANQWFVVSGDIPDNGTGTLTVRVKDAGTTSAESAFENAAAEDYAGSGHLPATSPVVYYNTYNPLPAVRITDSPTSAGADPFEVTFTIYDDKAFTTAPTFASTGIDILGGSVRAVGPVTAVATPAAGPGTLSNLMTRYTVSAFIEASAGTQVLLGVKAGAVTDAGGATNAAVAIGTLAKPADTATTVTVDTIAPTVKIVPATTPAAPSKDNVVTSIAVTFEVQEKPAPTTANPTPAAATILVAEITPATGNNANALEYGATAAAQDITVTGGTLSGFQLKPSQYHAIYMATIKPDATAEDVVITVKADAVSDRAGNSTAMVSETVDTGYEPDTQPPPSTDPGIGAALTGGKKGFTFDLPAITPSSSRFVVIAKSKDTATSIMNGISGATVIDIKDSIWQDLRDFLAYDGGTIDLTGPTGTTAKDLVISEVMWGSDHGLSDPAMSQWIELYNTKTTRVTGDTGTIAAGTWTIEFHAGAASTAAVSDRFSNRKLGQAHWNIPDTAGGAYGQSGRTRLTPGTAGSLRDLVSMRRKIDYAKVEKNDHKAAGTTNDVANRTEQLKGIPDGALAGSWEASTSRRNLSGTRKGTPGTQPLAIITQTVVNRGGIVFNEIGNRDGSTNDWIELYNRGSAEVKINKYELSKVGDDGKDVKLFQFESDQDVIIPAKGYLLVLNTDPSGTNIAEGADVNDSDGGEKGNGGGSSVRYYQNSGLNIPDDKFMLVLRTEPKLGSHEKIADIAGNQFVSNTASATEVWPLRATRKPTHADALNDLKKDDSKSWVRDFGKALFHHEEWKTSDVKGPGYKRSADSLNSGTPGYPNNAVQSEVKSDGLTHANPVVISEIMFGSGNGRVPQWIELYNPSMTQTVNLEKWTLEIQNTKSPDEDLRTETNSTLTLKKLLVHPNQTVLIVSTHGSTSKNEHFPSSRIYNLWDNHKEDLDMSSRRDAVLSSIGFYLELADPRKRVVDEIGNLDGNKRTNDDPTWSLPGGNLEDGGRASMIRRKGSFGDGTVEDAWISAAIVDGLQKVGINDLYFGSSDDIGTPGYRAGGPLPVQLSSFYSKRNDAGAVVITWSTESELDNAGFNILRSLSRVGEFTRINAQLIPGAGTTGEKNTYTWTDTSARPNVVYYYQIEDVSLDGDHRTLRTTRLRGYVGAAGKATTIWGELKSRD